MKLGAISFIVLLVASLFAAVSTLRSVRAQPYGPLLEHLRFQVILDPDARTLAMMQSQVDILVDLQRSEDVLTLVGAGKTLLSSFADQFAYVCFNLRRWYFGPQSGLGDGLALRHAIAHLVDKSTLVPDLFGFIADVIDVPMPAAIGDFGADVDPHRYDATHQMSIDILEAAGWTYIVGEGWYNSNDELIPEIDVMSPTFLSYPNLWEIADDLVENMVAIGLTVNHIPVPVHQLLDNMDAGNFDMCLSWWDDLGRFGDHLYDFFHSSQIGPGKYNRPGINNTALDALLLELYTTLDITFMRLKVKEALEMLMGTSAYQGTPFTDGFLPYIPIYSLIHYDAWDEDLLGAINAALSGSWNYWTVNNIYWRAGAERWSDLVPGGTMAIFTLDEDEQFPPNPAWASSPLTWNQLSWIYDSLIGVNPYNLIDMTVHEGGNMLDLSADPDWPYTPGWSCELWTVTDGPMAGEQGMRVTFYLNNTVPRYWHDGHQFDAYDVAFAWEFLAANLIPRAWGTFQFLHHVTIEDASTISAYMTTTGLTLPYGLSAWSCMFPEHIWGCTHSRGGRATPDCTDVNRAAAWNDQLVWINDNGGYAGTKPVTDPDAGDESGLCTCPGVMFDGISKTTCNHGCGCVLDDRTTRGNEILDYSSEDYPWPTAAYPWLTELVGTGPWVWYDYNLAIGIGNLIAFDERTHEIVMPGVHYWKSWDEIQREKEEMFWHLGDVELNGYVNIIDVARIAVWYQQTVPPAPWRVDVAPYAIGDQFIDMRDITVACRYYGAVREVFP